MLPNHFLETVEIVLARKNRTGNLQSADCLFAIAQCLRIMASTDLELGAVIITGVKLCGEGSWVRLARILEKFANDIRIEANSNPPKKTAPEISKAVA
jgi:hypothetical protein